jgi:hypothetical protein
MSKNFKKQYGKAQNYVIKHPKFFGMGLIVAFFIAFVMSAQIPGILPVFVICTISVILSSAALFVDYPFLNSIVIGYWCIYLVTIVDIIFMTNVILIHVINLVLATMVLAKRWKSSWPVLIFLAGLLWSTIIGTQNMVTHGESEYFRIFEWPMMGLYIMFNAFLATVIYLAQNPKQLKKLGKK